MTPFLGQGACLALEDSLALYERGVQLARYCHARLEDAERRIEIVNERGDVKPAPAHRPISLGIGEPKHATPPMLIEALCQAARDPKGGLASYPATVGTPALREGMAGWVQRRYGLALRGIARHRYVLSTKVGRVLRPDPAGSGKTMWAFDFSREGALASLASSLDRLDLERVDIVFVHDPDDHHEAALEGAYPALVELRDRGRIRAIGAGMNQWQMELAFARQGVSDCFLLAGRYTLLDQSALAEFLPYCVEHRISVIAGGPYNSGILAVGPRAGASFNYRPASAEMMDRAARIAAVCERHQVPLRAAALQFILAHPAVASVIPGARSVHEVEENVRLVETPIPDGLWAELKDRGLIDPASPTPGG